MNIPKVCRLVKVTSSGVQFGNAWYSHESITGYSADQLNQGNCCVTGGAYMKWLSEESPPQPIYDEAKERELFEEFYSERAKTLPLSLGNKPVRYAGGQYVNDFALFGWMVWLECAKSRAKSVEVGDE